MVEHKDARSADDSVRIDLEAVRRGIDSLAREATPDHGPRARLDFAAALLEVAVDIAADAYDDADRVGAPLPVYDDDPPPLHVEHRPVQLTSEQDMLAATVAIGRKRLGIPRRATTREVAAAVAALSTRREAAKHLRAAIKSGVDGARAAALAADAISRARVVAFVLSFSAEFANDLVARSVGSNARQDSGGRPRDDLLLDVVGKICAAGGISGAEAVRQLLAATDQGPESTRAEWQDMCEAFERRVKDARRRR